MPHIRLVSSSNLSAWFDPNQLLHDLVDALSGFETVDPRTIKAYWSFVETYVMGEGAPEGFVHCEIALMSGRPLTLRKEIAKKLAGTLADGLGAALESVDAGWTLDVREMEAETYLRRSNLEHK